MSLSEFPLYATLYAVKIFYTIFPLPLSIPYTAVLLAYYLMIQFAQTPREWHISSSEVSTVPGELQPLLAPPPWTSVGSFAYWNIPRRAFCAHGNGTLYHCIQPVYPTCWSPNPIISPPSLICTPLGLPSDCGELWSTSYVPFQGPGVTILTAVWCLFMNAL